MKLAYWYPEGTFSAWSISRGAINALGRMGHEVRACGIDPKAGPFNQDDYPTTVEMRSMDGVIISGPEHIGRVIRDIYPDWEQISVPKAAWLHETVRREDYGELNLDPIKRLADTIFCPAVQDEEFGFRFLPFGVDMDVFRPEPAVAREIDVGFIGLMYPKRQQYLDRIRSHLAGIPLSIANVEIKENGIVHPVKTVHAYATELRRMKVFVNLPTLSQLVVTKIYEVAACGACLITPMIKGRGSENHRFVRSNVRLYDEDAPEVLAFTIKTLLRDLREMEMLSKRLVLEMSKEHRIEFRLQTILDALKRKK